MSPRARHTLMVILAARFVGRVLAQMIQRYRPQSFLPPFAVFQGSHTPYWALFSAQVLILVWMPHVGVSVDQDRYLPRPVSTQRCAWFGVISTQRLGPLPLRACQGVRKAPRQRLSLHGRPPLWPPAVPPLPQRINEPRLRAPASECDRYGVRKREPLDDNLTRNDCACSNSHK